jgi:protein-S-isoprenylcysteine O-methyltransferase Ste14
MQRYFAVITILLLVSMVITRVFLLKRQGVDAFKFGKIDKKDFIIPPFALFYFYLILANAFNLPAFNFTELFHHAILSWVGVVFCFAGLLFVFFSLISFRKSFRVGIDVNHADDLITTGIFAYSRNPIYVGFGCVLLGQLLIFPSLVFLVYMLAGIWLFHRQVNLEENFLKGHYGRQYMEYCQRVRRYL